MINRSPSRTLGFQTTLQSLTAAIAAPPISNLPPHIFGCATFVHLHKHQRSKLAPHALQCVFVGYGTSQKGYRCYHPPSQTMYITRDVVFHEDTLYFPHEPELQGEHQKEVQLFDYSHNVQIYEMDDCSNSGGASLVPMAASPVLLMPQSPTSSKAPS